MRNLKDEQVKQASRVEAISRLIAEQETVVDLYDEQVRQASRGLEAMTRLIAEQKTVVAGIRREVAQQRVRIEELMREPVRQQHFEGHPLVRLARSYGRDDWWPELQSLRRISMLHFETLYLLRALAARTKDAIIEVGPYIGGSTIALGRGIQIGGGGPLISVEMGGSYPSHAVPTNDIIADLKRNIETYGLTESSASWKALRPILPSTPRSIESGRKVYRSVVPRRRRQCRARLRTVPNTLKPR